MRLNISATHYYEKESGILLHSNVSIYEQEIINPLIWINHTFIRNLAEFTDFTEEPPEEEFDLLIAIGAFFFNNAVELTLLALIILATVVAINRIHHQNVLRSYEEYKEIKRQEKRHSTNKPKNIKKES